MARIFIAMQNVAGKTGLNVMPPFYEAFVNGLKKYGNDVLCFHFNTVRREFVSVIPDSIKNKIIEFNPDVCIIFNNNFWDMTSFVSCPIVIYDVDSPLYFLHGDSIRENIERYFFVTSQIESVQLIKEIYAAKDNQIAKVPFFSEIQAEKIDIENNLVFIGSNWTWKGEYFVRDFMLKNPSKDDVEKARKVLEKYSEYPFVTSDVLYNENELFATKRVNMQNLSRCNLEISGLRRINYLQSVADLGLEIRGIYWDKDWMKYFPDVLMCFNNKPTFSLKDTQDFFNSAKIGFSTNHIQAISGYSWRTCDIIASNACLLCEYREGIQEAFPNVKLPMFTNPYEAREIAKRLLGDERERNEIVAAAHEILDEKYRFIHVLTDLQEFLGITLLNESDLNESNTGNIEYISDEYKELYPVGYVEEMKKRNYKKVTWAAKWNNLAVNNPAIRKKSIKIGKCRIVSFINWPKETRMYLGVVPVLKIETAGDTYKIRLLLLSRTKQKLCNMIKIKKQQIARKYDVERKPDCIKFKIANREIELINKNRYRKMSTTLKVLYKYGKVPSAIVEKYEKKLKYNRVLLCCLYKKDFKEYTKIIGSIDPCGFGSAEGELREYQNGLVEFYVEVAKILEENGIQFTLGGGGLIGAVRQQGFMPWDDDIDLELIREEYEKAKKLLAEKYYWYDSCQCKNFTQFFREINEIMRVYKDKIIVTETPSCVKIVKGTSLRDCMMVELFPYDYISDEISEQEFEGYLKGAQKVRREAATWGGFFEQMEKDREEKNIFVEKSNRLYYGYGNRGFVEFEFAGFRRAQSLFPIDQRMQFENVLMPVPHDVHEWLQYQYGNYMSLPKYIEENEHIAERQV